MLRRLIKRVNRFIEVIILQSGLWMNMIVYYKFEIIWNRIVSVFDSLNVIFYLSFEISMESEKFCYMKGIV